MGPYRIKAVSRLTGVRPELLRRWEKRYRLFKPQRAGNRYREFDDEDVQLLVYLRQQIDQGRSIGELAAEGRDAILRRLASATSSPPTSDPDYTPLIDELCGYIQRFDTTRLEARLLECSMHDSFTTMLYQVFVPLMQRLGALWVSNRMSPASEHFATALVKQRLLTMLQATAPAGCVPILLCACPAGERHELGLLTFAYTLQQEGWRICYLGADLPIVELRYACQQLRPALVALSLTYTTGPAQCLEVLQELDTVLASTYPTLVGGQGVAAYVQHLHPEYVRCCSTLDEAQAYARRLRFQRSGAEHGISTLGKVVGYQ